MGLFQIATLTYNRLLRYPFADEAKNNADLTLKGDLAETWEEARMQEYGPSSCARA